jgi:hypothetical protein
MQAQKMALRLLLGIIITHIAFMNHKTCLEAASRKLFIPLKGAF